MTPVEISRARVRCDFTVPGAARVYDHLLGGSANWAVDREFAARLIERCPWVRSLAVANRRWVGRVVGAALDAGITQFLDLGSGLPTVGAVHEIVARRTGQDGRVVYVDSDPVVRAHIELMLDRTAGDGLFEWVDTVEGDLRDPEAIFADDATRNVIDLTRPVCVLMVAVLHFVDHQTDVPALIGRYRDTVASGSWLAISHVAHDAVSDAAEAARITDVVDAYRATPTPAYVRDHAEINSWFTVWGGLLAPGLAHLPDWRPDEPTLDPATAQVRRFSWCGVGRKPPAHAGRATSSADPVRTPGCVSGRSTPPSISCVEAT